MNFVTNLLDGVRYKIAWLHISHPRGEPYFMTSEIRIDALLPSEMAKRTEFVGIRKAETPFVIMFALALLAGVFIALGAIFFTTTAVGSGSIKTPDGDLALTTDLPYGLSLRIAT